VALKEKVKFCSVCYNITENDPCYICCHPNRERGMICVVEEANDVLALERTGEYKGLFHVLGGALSPLEGVGPDDLRIKELMMRLRDSVREVIIATNPNAEGEATALYLDKLIKPLGIKVTRIARGLPVGGDIEYADEITLTRALEGRIAL
jgi:recombination protein RecR